MESHKLSPDDALSFILAGRSVFTIRKPSTNGRFTYRVSIPKDQKPENASIWFVSLLSGPENTNDYSYIGFIRDLKFIHGGSKARASATAPSVVVFSTVFNQMLAHGRLATNLEIWHEGKCGRCGRTLTVPESIERGIGPECAAIQSKFHHQLNLML